MNTIQLVFSSNPALSTFQIENTSTQPSTRFYLFILFFFLSFPLSLSFPPLVFSLTWLSMSSDMHNSYDEIAGLTDRDTTRYLPSKRKNKKARECFDYAQRASSAWNARPSTQPRFPLIYPNFFLFVSNAQNGNVTLPEKGRASECTLTLFPPLTKGNRKKKKENENELNRKSLTMSSG